MPPAWASSSVLTAVVVVVLGVMLAAHCGDRTTVRSADATRCEIAREWRTAHADASELEVISTEVDFFGRPGDFALGEGIVTAPLAVSADGIQEVLDTRTSPPASRIMRFEGNVVAIWEYAGRVHRDLRYTAHALVRRRAKTTVVLPETPAFTSLDREALLDATATAREVSTHSLDRCAELSRWAKETAGEPPHTAQLLRIAGRVAAGIRSDDEKRSRTHDVCASIRDGSFSAHRAHVLAVMAAREVGIPAYGFVTSDTQYYVSTFVDGLGWIALDITSREPVFVRPPAGLVTRVPTIAGFEASPDDFWLANGGAYQERMGSLGGLSWTEWNTKQTGTDVTLTTTVPLEKACR